MPALRPLTLFVGLGIFMLLSAFPSSAPAETSVGRYRQFGDAGGFLNIVPPGQDGVLNGPEALAAQAGQYPPHVKDQLGMYGDLVYNSPGLTDAQLTQFYKDASFGVPETDIDRVYSPTPGVTVVRDKSFGVPHIFGQTRYATMFAQGYTGAEDRLFLMDALRHVGRARLSEFLGASPSNEALDRSQLAIAPYKEADLTAQIAAIRNRSAESQQIGADGDAYVDGVNQYIREALVDPTKLPAEYPALQQVPQPWKLEDIIATATLVGGVFGKGGGGELTNFCGIKKMSAALGSPAAGRAAFDDFKFANDAEAPTTSHNTTPYMTDLGAPDPAATPDINCDSLKPIDGGTPSLDDILEAIRGALLAHTVDAPWGSFTLDFNHAMSNALLVSGSHTQTGHPIAVFGPQTGYFIPQLLVEKDVHGPGIDARGVSFAGTDIYVELGRGRNFAWSATSSSADNVDQWVLRLCEPSGGTPTVDSLGYLHNGVCEPIESYQHVQIAKPTAGGIPAGPDIVLSWRVDRTQLYGPLAARGTLSDGTPIAIASLRTTYGGELTSALGFFRVNDPGYMTNGFQSFRTAMASGVDYTFNWFYIDANSIGYQHSCKCPQRAAGVDPYLPAWGTGQWDWRGFIPVSAQPTDFNPPAGYLVSWNNKQAPGWKSNDSNFSYGPVHRSQLLEARIKSAIGAGRITRSQLVSAMEDAGTTDLRGEQDLALMLSALGPTAPAGSDPRAQDMRDRLAAWLTAQAHRRDLNHDGSYDDPQSPAIIDAWWTRLVHAMFDANSGNAIDNADILVHDAPQLHLGSAFDNGLYSQVNKDLRRVLGLPEASPWSKAYCGSGDLSACRAALWASLSQAAADLQTEFNSPNVSDWKRSIADDAVLHSAVGVTKVDPIHWINRPTFQQVVQINTAPGCRNADGQGSIPGKKGGQAQFKFHKHRCDQQGDVDSVSETDSSTGTNFQSTSLTAVTFDDVAHSVTMAGSGTDGAIPVTFVMTAIDGGALPGTFTLILSNGYAITGAAPPGSIVIQ